MNRNVAKFHWFATFMLLGCYLIKAFASAGSRGFPSENASAGFTVEIEGFRDGSVIKVEEPLTPFICLKF